MPLSGGQGDKKAGCLPAEGLECEADELGRALEEVAAPPELAYGEGDCERPLYPPIVVAGLVWPGEAGR